MTDLYLTLVSAVATAFWDNNEKESSFCQISLAVNAISAAVGSTKAVLVTATALVACFLNCWSLGDNPLLDNLRIKTKVI